MRIGKLLRNKLMRDEHTVMLSDRSCEYMGERYTFPRITDEDRLGFLEEATSAVEKLSKPTWFDWVFNI